MLDRHKEQWEKHNLDPLQKKRPPRKEVFKTVSGTEIDTLYLPDPDFDYMKKLGFPGLYPFTRGVMPNAYRGRLWTLRQYSGYGTAKESNVICCRKDKPDYPSLSISLPRSGTIATIPSPGEKSVRSESPSLPCKTWKYCSRRSPSAKFPPP